MKIFQPGQMLLCGCLALTGLLASLPAMATEPASPLSPGQASPTLSLDKWNDAERKKYFDIGAGPAYQSAAQVAVAGKQGLVSGTSGVLATHLGVETLKQGGTAADAAVVTALAQIVQTGGSAISFAGIMTLMYYDAASGKVHSMNAGYNTFQQETDPMTIPGMDLDKVREGGNIMEAMSSIKPSGRTAMVPGFMAGMQAMHDRFGKLGWASLFEPSIYLAEEGIPVDSYLQRLIASNEKVLSRLPETKAVFTKPDGSFYTAGDTFRQTALAGTFRQVAKHGAQYMYTGEWGKKFVKLVSADGGKVTMKDMQDYAVTWSEPMLSHYRNYTLNAPHLPAYGGINTVEVMNLLQAANLRQFNDQHWKSPEAMYWFSQITEVNKLDFLTDDEVKQLYPGQDLSLQARTTPATAQWEWEQIKATGGDYPGSLEGDKGTRHSAAIVAIDQWGNMAAIVHSINTVGWGNTGIFVDGVSIPDSAWFQQKEIAKAGPGKRLPDPTNPLIVLKDGKPWMAASSIGSSLHHQTVQGLYYMLEYGMDPNTAVSHPTFMGAGFGAGDMSLVESEVTPELIEGIKAKGLNVVPAAARPRFWLVATRDPETGELISTDAAVQDENGSSAALGLAEAY